VRLISHRVSGERLSLRELLHSTTIADKILFSLLLLLSLSGIFLIKALAPGGHTVVIALDNKPVYLLPLDKNRTVPVEGPMGKTFVEIKDNRVRIQDSPCHNKLCIRQGWIKKGSLVCLPNRVVVTIDGVREKKESVDAVTG
jgi:hypothetical protein